MRYLTLEEVHALGKDDIENLSRDECQKLTILRFTKQFPKETNAVQDVKWATSYLLFAGDTYYPSGGADDLLGTFHTLKQAKKAYSPANGSDEQWIHIAEVNTETNETHIVMYGVYDANSDTPLRWNKDEYPK